MLHLQRHISTANAGCLTIATDLLDDRLQRVGPTSNMRRSVEKVFSDVCYLRSSPISIPNRFIFAVVAGPTPWNFSSGGVSTKEGPIFGLMTTRPSGLRCSEASLARNLLYDTPAETVRLVSARIFPLYRFAPPRAMPSCNAPRISVFCAGRVPARIAIAGFAQMKIGELKEDEGEPHLGCAKNDHRHEPYYGHKGGAQSFRGFVGNAMTRRPKGGHTWRVTRTPIPLQVSTLLQARRF